MPQTDHPCVFWFALVLTLIGGGLTLGATTRVAYIAVNERKRFQHRLNEGHRILGEHNAARARLQAFKRYVDSPLNSPERRAYPSGFPLPDDEHSEAAVERKYEAMFREAVGRGMAEGASARDVMLMPEHTALAITNDQIAEFKSAVVLVAVGVITSTIGSVLSLWV